MISQTITWHDLKLNPKDLPTKEDWYVVTVYGRPYYNGEKTLYTIDASYDPETDEWEYEDIDREWMTLSPENNEVFAWTERIKPYDPKKGGQANEKA